MILKAHPDHPATSLATGEVVTAAVRAVGAPGSWFQVLHGRSAELGQALAAAPGVAAVAFTGSLRGGRALFDAAARRDDPIPVFAEMGSVNPVVVTPAALARRGGRIGELLAGTVIGSAGQLCTKPNLVLAVAGPGLDDLLGGVAGALREAPELVMLTQRLRDGFDDLVASPGPDAGRRRGRRRRGTRPVTVPGSRPVSRRSRRPCSSRSPTSSRNTSGPGPWSPSPVISPS